MVVCDEEFGDGGSHKGEGQNGIAEDVGAGLEEEAAEVVVVGLSGGEHGGADGDGVGRFGEGRVVGGVGELEGVMG